MPGSPRSGKMELHHGVVHECIWMAMVSRICYHNLWRCGETTFACWCWLPLDGDAGAFSMHEETAIECWDGSTMANGFAVRKIHRVIFFIEQNISIR